ncbi:MAG: PIN domain-containing protein [Vicinamibacteria bacterium]|nr:PIN domain-containing protein [Vicinamibacteria bacterium]
MRFLLDTNTVSDYLRGNAQVVKRIQAHLPRDLAISAVTVMELRYGGARRRSARLTAAIDAVLGPLTVLPFDAVAAERAGVVRAALEARGVAPGLADSQIAGQALAAGVTLVSSDSAFRRVPGLTVRNWSK